MMTKVIGPFADDALRTIGMAFKEVGAEENVDWEDENAVMAGLTLIGVVGIEDPVRPEVPGMHLEI